MKKLEMFGMPLSLDLSSGLLKAGSDDVTWEERSRKFSGKMSGLLQDTAYDIKDEPFYDFYKSLSRNKEREKFYEVNLRYDGIVIFPGTAGKEFKKTSGHFHLPDADSGFKYPEIYQVISGTALFVLQHVDDYKKEGRMSVDDVILAETHAGGAIVIPPDYGHCTVNITDEPLVFIDLVSVDSKNYYDSIKRSAGLSVYILKSDKGYYFEKNPHYDFKCEPKIIRPAENPVIGLKKNVPVYTQFLEDPSIYMYLNGPKVAEEEFFKILR